jgi:YCII-related domain
MHVAYFYLMKPEPERIRTAAPRHASYWQGLALPDYRGGPFADRSGGLIVFDSDSAQEAEELVSRDPFVHERLLERRWVKAWDAGAAGADDGGARKERAEP